MSDKLYTREQLQGVDERQLAKLIAEGAIVPMEGGAFELYRWTFPAIAASAINAGAVVGWTASAIERQVIPLGSTNVEPIGIALATANYLAATPPFTAAVPLVDRGNTTKVVAAGSLGVGADIGIASGVSGTYNLQPVSAASGIAVWRVGKSVSPAAAGETFSLYVDPRQLSGLA
jgi:hypothetical protein